MPASVTITRFGNSVSGLERLMSLRNIALLGESGVCSSNVRVAARNSPASVLSAVAACVRAEQRVPHGWQSGSLSDAPALEPWRYCGRDKMARRRVMMHGASAQRTAWSAIPCSARRRRSRFCLIVTCDLGKARATICDARMDHCCRQ